ncbi:zinc finger protein 385B isoform X3 [Callorhinchus milii]|uniref:Zinc finger protein 385B n=1 Tax=Callorhinchus milii TaxID=7868 RepID=A0A4W3IRA8_CALMI|nr:zinc finger protein 385B isoform X3 [Callorhinchus milii]|eukprot:gi/632945883/ref/XP_007888284.1/ PREDICTED: zinc finger protein 385B isoform X3 [Callorhinchus milii]
MKRPRSPDHAVEDGTMSSEDLFGYSGGKGANTEGLDYQGLHQEKRRIGLALCEVCNIQLNSPAQAEVHYNGKSHLKRMKQFNNGHIPVTSAPDIFATSTSTGSTCHTSTLPALVRTPTLMMQPSLNIKPFMPFPMDTGPAVGLFPNFNTSQAEAHYKGSKHAKKLKALEATKNKQKSVSAKDSTKVIITTTTAITPNSSEKTADEVMPASNSVTVNNLPLPTSVIPERSKLPPAVETTGNVNEIATKLEISTATASVDGAASIASTSTESEEEKAKKLLYCSLCKVAVNSLSQLEAHNTGSKHRTMVEARIGAGPIKSYPRPGSKAKLPNGTKGSGLQNKTFHCEVCDVHVNSEIQLKQHISSRRHKDRVAGKPLKPKYSPYNKLQRNPTILAAKLAFRKDLLKPLPPGFLTNPFVAAAALTSPLALHPRPATSLFQATALQPALLRPAPGPMRPSPSSILFAPY